VCKAVCSVLHISGYYFSEDLGQRLISFHEQCHGWLLGSARGTPNHTSTKVLVDFRSYYVLRLHLSYTLLSPVLHPVSSTQKLAWRYQRRLGVIRSGGLP